MVDLAANQEVIVCPYCQDNVPSLVNIDAGMRLRLQETGTKEAVPERVCEGCYKLINKMVSKGAVLKAEQQVKEQNRLILWRNRVQLVKQAKVFLAQNNFADAAVSFEKYIRVLEIIYETKAGELNPELFKNDSKAQEITVIASVYWDLMRIYDSHATYRDRQIKAADKLAEFVRYTPIYAHIIRKAEGLTRTGKNPEAFKRFLKQSNSKRPRCFVATSAFDGYASPTVISLCAFRDEHLARHVLGRKFIYLYYRVSPKIADWLDQHAALKPIVRKALTALTQIMAQVLPNSSNRTH